MSTCFTTLAIHAPYRRRARLAAADTPDVPWRILTDQPADFDDLAPRVRAVAHAPTGPMAVDYLAHLPSTGGGRGAAAYHDKRFALAAGLAEFETAIFVDADSRIGALPPLGGFPPGIAALPVVRRSVADHIAQCGTWRTPAFLALARALTGGTAVLDAAPWCNETMLAVTRDGRERAFLEVWGRAAALVQGHGVFSGEGGVIGIAAHLAGWTVDFTALDALGCAVRHEGGGPKSD